MSNPLNKLRAPLLLQDSRGQTDALSAADSGLQPQRRSSPCRPAVLFEVRAEEIKGSFNRGLFWLLSYAGQSSRSRGQYRCELAGAKQCVFAGDHNRDTEANKDKAFFQPAS